MKSLKNRVIDHVTLHPYRSASQIANALGYETGTVHETLRRLKDAGIVDRHFNGGGPRGGSTWTLKGRL